MLLSSLLRQCPIIDPRGRPQSRPVVITIFTYVVRQSVQTSVRPFVRTSGTKLQNPATITAGRDCGLAKWIIDDSCLVFFWVSSLSGLVQNSLSGSKAAFERSLKYAFCCSEAALLNIFTLRNFILQRKGRPSILFAKKSEFLSRVIF